MEDVECTCGCEWGIHSSWCAMNAFVIRDTEPALTAEDLEESRYHAARFLMAEELYKEEIY